MIPFFPSRKSTTPGGTQCGGVVCYVTPVIKGQSKGHSEGREYKCKRCGALGHKAAICRAPNAFAGACGTCGAYGHMSRQCHCPYACQRYHRRAAGYALASASSKAGGGQYIADGTVVVTLACIRAVRHCLDV